MRHVKRLSVELHYVMFEDDQGESPWVEITFNRPKLEIVRVNGRWRVEMPHRLQAIAKADAKKEISA